MLPEVEIDLGGVLEETGVRQLVGALGLGDDAGSKSGTEYTHDMRRDSQENVVIHGRGVARYAGERRDTQEGMVRYTGGAWRDTRERRGKIHGRAAGYTGGHGEIHGRGMARYTGGHGEIHGRDVARYT